MTWATLAAVRYSLLEFSKASGLREVLCLGRLPSGRWTRTLGPPGKGVVHVRGNVWHLTGRD